MMNNKSIYILISTIILILLGGVSYWYFVINKAPTEAPVEFPGEGDLSKTKPSEEASTEEGEVPPGFIPGKTAELPRLYELHKAPVAGVGFFEEGKGVYHKVSTRYIERGLGHIFETPLHTYKESRIVNETRPRISEALWGNNGRSVAIRYLDKDDSSTIITRVINILPILPPSTLGTSTEAITPDFNKTEEVFFPDYIPFLSVAGDNSDSLFYLENSKTVSVGTISNYNNSGSSKIFNSSFTEWLPQFPNKNLVTLTTKPSSDIPGYMYFLNTRTRSISKILSDIKGLTTLTNLDGNLILYSETKGSTPSLSIYSVNTGTSISLDTKTLPEKCVWGRANARLAYCAIPHSLPDGIYPDQWYQGLISFSDDLWEIDTITMEKKKIMSPADFGFSSFDIINPSISSDDTYISFMNKLTGTPWVYRISETVPPAPLPEPVVEVSTTTATTTNKNNAKTGTPVMKKIK